MLKIQKINKFFGEKQVVCDFDLEMEQGEIVCLLGESGCGKTTTLQMIGGFLSPDSGKIELNGLDITISRAFFPLSKRSAVLNFRNRSP